MTEKDLKLDLLLLFIYARDNFNFKNGNTKYLRLLIMLILIIQIIQIT